MRSIRGLKEGDKVTIRYGEDESYTSIVQSINENGEITTYAPLDEKKILTLKPNDTAVLSFVRPDAQYEFDAVVKKRYRQRDINFIEFVPTSEYRRIQRRQYYRLKISLDAYVRVIRQGDEGDGEDEWIKMHTVDISGQGMQLKSYEAIPDHSILDCVICLDEEKTIRVKGEVKEVYETEEGPIPYRLRIYFFEITEQQKKEIIQFIFKKQMEMRAKALMLD